MVSLQVLTGIGFQHDLYATLYTQNVKQGHCIYIKVERVTQYSPTVDKLFQVSSIWVAALSLSLSRHLSH